MRRIAQVLAIAAALAAFPAAADVERTRGARTDGPIRGSDRDPFSQTYDGRSPEDARDLRDREEKGMSCETSCACGHAAEAQQHPKA
jgi:hypothetical protein